MIYMQKKIFICIKKYLFICRKLFSDSLAAEKLAVTSPRRLLLLIMCCFAAQTESHNINEMTLVLWLICAICKITNFHANSKIIHNEL